MLQPKNVGTSITIAVWANPTVYCSNIFSMTFTNNPVNYLAFTFSCADNVVFFYNFDNDILYNGW